MLGNKQAEEAIVANETEHEANREESKEVEDTSVLNLKSFLWHGGSAWDAWFSCASNQVAQVLLTLPYSFSQLGFLSGILFQIFYGLVGSWTAYLISVLYLEYRSRKEKENVNFKNHVIQENLRTPHEFQHGDAVMEAIVKDRCGSVLGKGSILKMYFFPGQRTSSYIQIHGAPHVFKVDGYPLYSMATPTIAGAKETLAYLGAKPTVEGSIVERVIIIDLREEAVVYINGTPFVLRELNKPVDTLKHVGITGPAVEHMEARLKEDIISEVRRSGGRMLLHREEFSPALNQVSIIGYWENIFVDDVKTPSEVYASLEKDGFNITYRRIPLTREREALTSDVDTVQYCMDQLMM